MNKIVTVFTPTYNRAYTLERLYNSLKAQSNKNFEWVVVDDGSLDNTEELIRKFIKKEHSFKIVYYKQKNGGKHRAINKGLEMANGYMFFIVDSDDYLTKDAIEKVLENEKTISNCNFAGIAMARAYPNMKMIGTSFGDGDYVDATSLERKKYNINGDKAEIFYTKLLKKNKFPEIKNEKFMTEAVVWNRIASQGYKIRWYNDIIYICEYLEDGLTKNNNELYKKNPQGTLLYVKENIKFAQLNILQRLIKYSWYSEIIYDNNNIKQAAKDLKISSIILKVAVTFRRIAKLFREGKNG